MMFFVKALDIFHDLKDRSTISLDLSSNEKMLIITE